MFCLLNGSFVQSCKSIMRVLRGSSLSPDFSIIGVGKSDILE